LKVQNGVKNLKTSGASFAWVALNWGAVDAQRLAAGASVVKTIYLFIYYKE
jgi:hypothetical protein